MESVAARRPRRLVVPRPLWDGVIEHCRRELPREACGLLAGREHRVFRVVPLPNVSPTPREAYLAEPEALYRALLEIEGSGEEVLAVYHSHPGGPPLPSPRDLAEARWPGVVHVVVSLAGTRPEGRAFLLPAPGGSSRVRGGAIPVPLHLEVSNDSARQSSEM